MKIKNIYSLRNESTEERSKPYESREKKFGLLKKIESRILSMKLWEKFFSKYTKNIQISNEEIYSAKIPDEFDGFKILFISDLHLDIEPNPIEKFLNMEIPNHDIVVLGGDYFDNPNNPNMDIMDLFLNKLDKPIFAIMGNHDNLDVLNEMEKAGVTFLLNESIEISKKESKILMSGIEETVFRESNLQHKVLKESLDKKDIFKVILSHSPDMLISANNHEYDLQLSGHTHGGQLLIFNRAIIRNTKHDFALSGKWKYRDLQGYTSSGFGSSGFPVRNIYPEVCLLTLKREKD